MVDVAGGVVVPFAVDRPFGVDVEQVASATAVGFCVGDLFTGVFDDECSLGNIGRCEEAESGSCAGSLYCKDGFRGC